jgi:site-specific recombinase XerD
MQTANVQKSDLPIKISEFLDYLAVERGSSVLTLRNYSHYLGRFSEFSKNKNLSDISAEHIRAYRLYLANLKARSGSNLSRRTQSYHVIALRSLLKWLTKNDFDVISPEKLELPKISERKISFLSGEQVDRLLSAPSMSTINGKRDKALLEVLFSTGLRVSELVSLNQDDINLKLREFGVVGKGGKARVVFLSSRAADWLENYLDARRDHFKPLFIRHKGNKGDVSQSDEQMRLTVRSVQRLVQNYARKIKLPMVVTPHVLRHSFATDLLVAGADLRSVQEMLGHKNIATTQIYTHVTNKHLRDIHEAFHGHGK